MFISNVHRTVILKLHPACITCPEPYYTLENEFPIDVSIGSFVHVEILYISDCEGSFKILGLFPYYYQSIIIYKLIVIYNFVIR